jgi:hypothetical protein
VPQEKNRKNFVQWKGQYQIYLSPGNFLIYNGYSTPICPTKLNGFTIQLAQQFVVQGSKEPKTVRLVGNNALENAFWYLA